MSNDLDRLTATLREIGCDFMQDDPDQEDLEAIRETSTLRATRTVIFVNRVSWHFDIAGRFLGTWNDQWPRGIVRRGRGL